ncbi:Fe-S-containing protein [Pasteurella bettyae]|nr:Fe-S-containing protein [Pasteurella bettyae]
MTYFFTFLLQTLLPTALLLSCSWSIFPTLKIKKLIGLSLIAIFLGMILATILPNNQTITLTINIIMLISVLLFCICQLFKSQQLNSLWHCILLILASYIWAKDPSIKGITNTDVINTDFILHLSAIILGVIFCFFLACWFYILIQQCKKDKKLTALSSLFLIASAIIILIPVIGNLILGLMKLQVIELTKFRLSFVAKSGNLYHFFNYIYALLLFIVLILFGWKVHHQRRFRMNNEMQPIEKRKKTASFQHTKKTLLWGILSILIMISTQLYWDNIASRPPQLSEAIKVSLDSEKNVHIPIEQVKDGRLHRFVWIADDGKAIRFLLINRQPDKLSFAPVFDACLLCGDQGYVMQDNQVVCVGCGVRIFTPSIGKEGGCNPVPIADWHQTDTDIVISKAGLLEGINLFTTIVEIPVVDPVDGSKLTNKKTEFKYSYEDKTYFFSTEENLERFRNTPEKYIQEDK